MATKIVDVKTGVNGAKLELPPMHKVVHVEYTDPETELLYAGDFTIKRLTLGELRQAAIRRAQLNGGIPEEAIEENIRFLNAVLSKLEFNIVSSPEWWNPDAFFSGRVIFDLYDEVTKFEDSFRRPARGGSQTSEASGKGQTATVRAPTEKVVDKEVPATADV